MVPMKLFAADTEAHSRAEVRLQPRIPNHIVMAFVENVSDAGISGHVAIDRAPGRDVHASVTGCVVDGRSTMPKSESGRRPTKLPASELPHFESKVA